jgi:hypothetical protein
MTESVLNLKGLKFNSEAPPTAKWKMNPTEARRNALLNSIATQRLLVKRERGEAINLTKTVKKENGDGVIAKVQVERHPRQWFWNTNGVWHIQIMFGGVPISINGKNTTIVAGNSLDDVDAVFSVVESAVRSGELDPKIDDASAKSKIGRRKKA